MLRTDKRLGISPVRRVVGVCLVVAMYAVSIVAFLWPHIYDQLATANSLLLPYNAPVISLVALSCAVILSPYILLPSMFDRFPRLLYRLHTDQELRRMANWFFGAGSKGPGNLKT